VETHLDLPESLRDRLAGAHDVPAGLDAKSTLEAAVRHSQDAGEDPTEVLKTLAQWAADDESLPTDYVILTAPIGVKLDAPWTMAYEDVACYVAFHRDFAPERDGVPLDLRGIANLIGQRMRFNAVKKAQNYTVVKRFPPQSFNLPDIAVAEDANHEGHRASGIRHSCRIPTMVHAAGMTWKGIADVRLNRTIYRPHSQFRPSDVPLASRYAIWLGWIVDEVYARKLQLDPRYGRKLRKGEA
jgi:hypothetical protein